MKKGILICLFIIMIVAIFLLSNFLNLQKAELPREFDYLEKDLYFEKDAAGGSFGASVYQGLSLEHGNPYTKKLLLKTEYQGKSVSIYEDMQFVSFPIKKKDTIHAKILVLTSRYVEFDGEERSYNTTGKAYLYHGIANTDHSNTIGVIIDFDSKEESYTKDLSYFENLKEQIEDAYIEYKKE